MTDVVGPFVEALRATLVPGCDRDVVAAALADATTGSAGPRGRDGRRASALTPSGAPFEASVTGGGGRSGAALRYVCEPGTRSPYFGPRLAAQRRAIADLSARLAPGDGAGDEVGALLDVAFPDPASVPARTRFASFVGVVHTARHPRHLAGLKGYVNLRAAGRDASVRLARRWPGFRVLGDVVGDLAGDGGPLTTEFAALEVGDGPAVAPDVPASRGGRVKLYLRTRTAGAAGAAPLVRRVGGEVDAFTAALADAGVRADGWRRPVFACVSTGAAGSGGVDLSVHVPARALDLGADDMAGVARSLVERHGAAQALPALVAAMAAAGDTAFGVTVVGVGLPPGGGIGKVNVYAAPR